MARVCGTDFDIVVWEGGWDIVEKGKHHPKERETLPEFKFGVLRRLFFEVTDLCNYRCIHCYNAPYRVTNSITVEIFASSLRKLSKYYTFEIIQITGGEPSLHPELKKLVDTARKFSKTVEIFTNGSLLNRIEKELKPFRNSVIIRISFYSFNRELYRRITRTTIDPLYIVRKAVELKDKGFDIRIEVPLIPQQNETELQHIYSFFREQGIPVKSSYIIPYGNATDVDPGSIPFERKLPSQQSWVFYPPSIAGYSECWATHLAVDTSLNVYPCIFAREWHLGNLEKDAIEIIFENHKRVSRQYSADNLELCKNCAFRHICKRCPPRAKAHGVLGIAEAGCPLVEKRRK